MTKGASRFYLVSQLRVFFIRSCLAFSLAALLCFHSIPAFSQGCHQFLEVQTSLVKSLKTDSMFMVEVPQLAYSFEATLNEDGVLHIAAFLSYPDLGVRSHLRGSDLYKEMIEHFGLARIKKIRGTWLDGTNYEQFFDKLDEGYSEEEAALATWSGRQAQKFGFTRVESVEVEESTTLKLTTVKVSFVRED